MLELNVKSLAPVKVEFTDDICDIKGTSHV